MSIRDESAAAAPPLPRLFIPMKLTHDAPTENGTQGENPDMMSASEEGGGQGKAYVLREVAWNSYYKSGYSLTMGGVQIFTRFCLDLDFI